MSEPEARSGGMPRPVKWLLLLVLAAVVIVILFTVVFPEVEKYFEDPTLGALRVDLPRLLGR